MQSRTGFTAEELEARDLSSVLGPEAGAQWRHLDPTPGTSTPPTATAVCHRRDGSPFYGLLCARPLPAGELPGAGAAADPPRRVLLTVADVTGKVQRVDKYEVGKVLGRGAFGVVHLAKNSLTGWFLLPGAKPA